jgi:hypothetical protein
MSQVRIAALALMALLSSITTALGGEPVPTFASHQVLNVPPAKCHDKAKFALVQFQATDLQDNGGFLAGFVRGRGSVTLYCLTNGNPNQSWLIVVAGSTTGGGAKQLRESIHAQILANP